MVAQYDVVKLRNGPLVIVLQDDRVSGIVTRIVAPLVPVSDTGIQPRNLCPVVNVDGNVMVCLTQSMAALPLRDLEFVQFNLSHRREEFIRALDLLFTGV